MIALPLLLLASLSLPLSTVSIVIPLTYHHPPRSLNSSSSSSSSEDDSWTRTVVAMEALERKYVKWYDHEYDFAGKSRERRAGRGGGSNEEGEGGWLGKRADGTLSLTNVYGDATYVAALTVGKTAVQSLNVILDTGSADLWLSSSSCSTCTGSAYELNPSSSPSMKVTTTPFSIVYGSGSASGTLATDTVTLGPFSVEQTFGLVTSTSSNLIFSPLSGIMGLAFQSIATSGAVPFWYDLLSSSQLTQPLMAFYLTRYFGTSSALNEGGSCTFGATDSSLYSGDINYIDMPSGSRTYWLIPFDLAIVDDVLVTLAANTNAAIDTGTTLIVGPTEDVAAIYAQIDGAKDVGGGHWVFPCTNTVSVSFVFGGTPYALTSADMSRGLYETGSSFCVGAISASDLGSNAPMSWIIGAAFLKNVYSVFRATPPSIGFALLSESAGGSPAAPSVPSADTTTTTTAAATSAASRTSSSSAAVTSSRASSSTSSQRSSTASSASSASASAATISTTTTAGGEGGIVTGILPGAAEVTSSSAAVASASGVTPSSGARQSLKVDAVWVGVLALSALVTLSL
ncbi:aspartic peptidase domain-containing protein [Mrakia frigida]|uniref:aspartic peptidase domain-containing protein n=1 Tax=Mrakia frigida TaxID=29902 RepID=UPI003FCBFF04